MGQLPHAHCLKESGKFLAGRILSEAESSAQIELDSGKRVKAKAAHILLKFEKPAPADLLAQGQALAQAIDLQLAWEFAPEGEFGFADLARDYFSENAADRAGRRAVSAVRGAALFPPRRQRGVSKKGPGRHPAAGAGRHREEKAVLAQIAEWAGTTRPRCLHCAPIANSSTKILFAPTRTRPNTRLWSRPARHAHRAAGSAAKAGAIDSSYQFHWKRFLLDNFPRARAFCAGRPQPPADLPLAEVQAFSIDDSQTTESTTRSRSPGSGRARSRWASTSRRRDWRLSSPAARIDQLGRNRLSTVYMPGYKITMLPDSVVQIYTLDEGRANPAVSLYCTIDEATLEITATETRLERVPVVANLRHDQLDHIVTEAWLADPSMEVENTPERLSSLRVQLSFFAPPGTKLKAGREVVRGKPRTSTGRTTTSARGRGRRAGRQRRPCRSPRASAARRSTSSSPRPPSSPTAPGAGWLASLGVPASTAARPAWRRA